MKRRASVLLFFLILLLPFRDASGSEDILAGVEDGWIWQIVLLPPSSGWESDAGISALGAVRCEEEALAKSAGGAGGRDVHFLKEEALTPENLLSRMSAWREKKIAAVLSFGDGEEAALLGPHLGASGPVFLSAFGENIDLMGADGVAPLMFALDLHHDFRVDALALYAEKTLSSGDPVSILGDRLDPVLEGHARRLAEKLAEKNFSPSNYWIAGAGIDSFDMIQTEAMASGAKVFVSLAGTMVVRDLWLGSRRHNSPYALWYGSSPRNFLRAFEGILAVDQNFPLTQDRAFITLGREIRKKQHVMVRDEIVAGRAAACSSWLFKALGRARSADARSLAQAMEKVGEVKLGSRVLLIDRAAHRPKEREVAFLTVRKGNFHPLLFLTISGVKEVY